jgi:hypothetical protein
MGRPVVWPNRDLGRTASRIKAMTDAWYYAEGQNIVGPLALTDLTSVLSRIANAADVPVWKTGSPQWQKAGDTPELAGHVLQQSSLPQAPSWLQSAPPKLQDFKPQDIVPGSNVRPARRAKNGPAGIGGWLVLVMLSLLLTPANFVTKATQTYLTADAAVLKFPIALSGTIVLAAAMLGLILYSAYLFFRESADFPKRISSR